MLGGSKSNLTISGGEVTAIFNASGSSANQGTVISGGYNGGKTIISGGNVTAIINAVSFSEGTAIGSPANTSYSCNLEITGGSVRAEINSPTNRSAAIGSYKQGTITISGGEVWAVINSADSNAAAVGGQYWMGSYSGGANLTLNGGKLNVSGGNIGAGTSSSASSKSPGTIKFSDKNDINRYFNDLDRPIYNGVSTIRDMSDTPLYKTEIQIGGVSFTPNRDVTYTIGDVTYTSKADSSGRLYLYLPLSDDSDELKVRFGGINYEGTIELLNNHDNVLLLAESDDQDPPNPPDTANSPGGGLWVQTGANAIQGVYLHIEAMNSEVLGLRDSGGNNVINVQRQSGADITGLFDIIDSALTKATNERSNLGAMQNRLEFTINSLSAASENLSAADSRIRDADMAKEMMVLAKNNALSQASMLILSQVNQQQDVVLTLLRS